MGWPRIKRALLFWNFFKNYKIIKKSLFYEGEIGFIEKITSYILTLKTFLSIKPLKTARSFLTLGILIKVKTVPANLSSRAGMIVLIFDFTL